MKQQFAELCAIALLSVASAARAQSIATPFVGYDINQEVRISGTVESSATQLTRSEPQVARLLLATSSGTLELNLGAFTRGRYALPLASGQTMEVTGLEKTVNGTHVLLVRIVKAGGQTYVIRNERGLPVSPLTRERAAGKNAKDGGTL
jgi:hypothetical protein